MRRRSDGQRRLVVRGQGQPVRGTHRRQRLIKSHQNFERIRLALVKFTQSCTQVCQRKSSTRSPTRLVWWSQDTFSRRAQPNQIQVSSPLLNTLVVTRKWLKHFTLHQSERSSHLVLTGGQHALQGRLRSHAEELGRALGGVMVTAGRDSARNRTGRADLQQQALGMLVLRQGRVGTTASRFANRSLFHTGCFVPVPIVCSGLRFVHGSPHHTQCANNRWYARRMPIPKALRDDPW